MQKAEQLVSEAEHQLAQGSLLSAFSLLRQALKLAPDNAYAASRLADLLLQQGQWEEGETLLRDATANSPRFAPAHLLLARIAWHRGQTDAALASLDEAIRHDNAAWGARIEKAQLLETLGRMREASLCWSEAVRSMPPHLRESPQMEGLVGHARTIATRNLSELRDHLMAKVEPVMQGQSRTEIERFAHALDIVTGRREFVTAQPLFLPIPRLPAIPFFHPESFGWAPRIQEATDEIAAELEHLLDAAAGEFTPYVQTRRGNSSGQFADLDRNPDWSAFFLWKHGQRIDSHCAICPVTDAVVAEAPLPRIRARAPAVMFSKLEAGAHIPAHNGATNARLTVHLPLIVPPGCAFQVGDEVREWKRGELMIFDDTIRHEAWNQSDRPRTILIFDIWHPMLSDLERELVTRTVEGLVEYYDDANELHSL